MWLYISLVATKLQSIYLIEISIGQASETYQRHPFFEKFIKVLFLTNLESFKLLKISIWHLAYNRKVTILKIMRKRKLHTSVTIHIDWCPLWINMHTFRHKINKYVFRSNKSCWFLSLGMWLVLCFFVSQVLLIVNLKCDWWVGWFIFSLLKPVQGPTIWLLRRGEGGNSYPKQITHNPTSPLKSQMVGPKHLVCIATHFDWLISLAPLA